MTDLFVPDHVPPELVYDFDIWNMAPGVVNPHDHCITLRKEGVPRIFYTPRNGGHWMLHHFDDTLEGYRDTDFFTNFPNGIPARPMPPDLLIPVEVDPPHHKKYRDVLGPAFSPVAVKRVDARIRSLMTELVDRVIDQGECDFVEDISGKLPTGIFLTLMGMPLEDFDHIMELEHRNVRGETEKIRAQGSADIFAYVSDFVLSRQNNEDTADLTGILLRSRTAENPWSMDEIINCACLLYIAGLDTVTNMMNFIWHRLATRPDEQAYVASHHDGIAKFVDELMRMAVPSFNARRARSDGMWRGIFMKAGDAVLNSPFNANRDPAFFPDPDSAVWDRENARHHIAFGAGPHRCVGQHLARQEILVALQEWFGRIPSFALSADRKIEGMSGNIMAITKLPLSWSVA